MIELNIPGRDAMQLEHLVMDVNGTLATDGRLLTRLVRPILNVKSRLAVHLITADTYGKQGDIDFALGLQAVRLAREDQAQQKAEYVKSLGADRVVAIGNGANDALMLKEAALGIACWARKGWQSTHCWPPG